MRRCRRRRDDRICLADYATEALGGRSVGRGAGCCAGGGGAGQDSRASGRARLAVARAACQVGEARAAEAACRAGLETVGDDAGLDRCTRTWRSELATIAARERPSADDIDALIDDARRRAETAGVGLAAAHNAAGLVHSHRSEPGWEAEFVLAETLARQEGDDEQECAAAYWRASAYGFHGPYARVRPLVRRMLAHTSGLGSRAGTSTSWWSTPPSGPVRAGSPTRTSPVLDGALTADPPYRNRGQFEAVLAIAHSERGEIALGSEVVLRARSRARDDEERSLALVGAAEVALAAEHVPGMLGIIEEFQSLTKRWFLAGALVESAAIHLWLHVRALGGDLPPLPPVDWPPMAGMAPVRTSRAALEAPRTTRSAPARCCWRRRLRSTGRVGRGGDVASGWERRTPRCWAAATAGPGSWPRRWLPSTSPAATTSPCGAPSSSPSAWTPGTGATGSPRCSRR